MSVTKASLLSLAINLIFSSVLSASKPLTDTDVPEKKLPLKTKETAQKSSWEDEISALINQYQNPPEVPSETKGCRDVYQIRYKDPVSGNWVCAE
ncbi:MAG: hypothetical protein BGO76_04995 [Caedibacter sp. 38-128]|nr:hypothetical protein [Holosporales bacterium]OJX07233.1 MAG: hypothetical protein BGO76_04995 [Caedibacter sp. 38-128]